MKVVSLLCLSDDDLSYAIIVRGPAASLLTVCLFVCMSVYSM
jgi:hypothetical protein